MYCLPQGGGSKPQSVKKLYTYADSSAIARLTIDGPITADQTHNSVQISVDQYSVTFDKIQGYTGHIVNQVTNANNEPAYDNFLHALYHAGFTLGNTNSALSDEKGYCPLGNRYILEFISGGSDIERFWATSCGNPKTFNGNLTLVTELFKAQVPNYSNLTESTNI